MDNKDNSDTEADFLDRDNKSISKNLNTAKLSESKATPNSLIAASVALRASLDTKPNKRNISQFVNTKDLQDKDVSDKNNRIVNKGVVGNEQSSSWQQQHQNSKINEQ